jgi:hypothetical protein
LCSKANTIAQLSLVGGRARGCADPVGMLVRMAWTPSAGRRLLLPSTPISLPLAPSAYGACAS